MSNDFFGSAVYLKLHLILYVSHCTEHVMFEEILLSDVKVHMSFSSNQN